MLKIGILIIFQQYFIAMDIQYDSNLIKLRNEPFLSPGERDVFKRYAGPHSLFKYLLR
jgi:hypothetical protein